MNTFHSESEATASNPWWPRERNHSQQLICSFLTNKPFFLNHNPLSLNNLKLAYSSSLRRRSYTCRAIYNPEVLVKKEGQPETLDYRVFFLDKSGKKDVKHLFLTPPFAILKCSFRKELDLQENEVDDHSGQWLSCFPDCCTSLVSSKTIKCSKACEKT